MLCVINQKDKFQHVNSLRIIIIVRKHIYPCNMKA